MDGSLLGGVRYRAPKYGANNFAPDQNLTRCCFHALPRISALPFLLAAVVTTVGAQAALAHLFRQTFRH